MALQNCRTTPRVREIGAFSPTSFQPPLALGSGVVWTGQNQLDFVTYHAELQKRITNYLTKSKENEKDPRQPQVTIYDIKPMWLEAEEASEFYLSSLGRYVHFFPLKKKIHMITVPKYQSVKKVLSLTDEVFPHNKGKSFAQLPAHFTLSLKDKPQYAWVRLLAWNVKGYISNTFKKRNLSQLREPNFNATILSVLPSGHIDAVAGLIEICTNKHISSVKNIIPDIQEFYCKKSSN
ncbi:hypothetical protein DSO57_1030517 [Entomophthora muscae]|uniref:Uncharacterized protein n=1 Tax=Entomophthora muscae TaxID=34485 RepID=A0ACC2UMW5_9FUNG|nr:hypothetical protein DSO57_1030517 [Entomophthora muscae]